MKNKTTATIGSAPEVSDIDIITAGQTLVKQKKNVTGFALRKAVGDKGTPKRLYAVWQEYQSSHNGDLMEEAELSEDITKALDDAMKSVADTLQSIVKDISLTIKADAKSQVTSAMNLAEQRQNKANEEMSDALSTIEEFQRIIDEKQNNIEQLTIELKSQEMLLKEKNITIENIESDIREQVDLFQLASTENEKLTNEVNTKQNEINSLHLLVEDLKVDKISLNKQMDYLNDLIKKQDESLDKLVDPPIDKIKDMNADNAA